MNDETGLQLRKTIDAARQTQIDCLHRDKNGPHLMDIEEWERRKARQTDLTENINASILEHATPIYPDSEESMVCYDCHDIIGLKTYTDKDINLAFKTFYDMGNQIKIFGRLSEQSLKQLKVILSFLDTLRAVYPAFYKEIISRVTSNKQNQHGQSRPRVNGAFASSIMSQNFNRK